MSPAQRAMLIRWAKFSAVGGLGIVVQLATLFVVRSILQVHYLAATAIAVEAAVLHNFAWHERFTWADRTDSDARKLSFGDMSWRNSSPRLLRFHLSNGAVSIVGNLVLMKVLTEMAHENYMLANGVAIATCSLLNFIVSEYWVYGASSD